MAEQIINQIPGYENGIMQAIGFDDAEKVLPHAAEVVSELLNKWNTTVLFISLTCRSEALKALVKNESKVARLYTIDQRNPDPNVILRKARGAVNCRFVRAIVLEGVTISPQQIEYWSKRFRRWSTTHEIIIGVVCDD